MLIQDTRARLRALAEEYLREQRGAHGIDHTVRVAALILRLARHYAVDLSALEAAAWLHDIGRGLPALNGGGHGARSAQVATQVLPPLGFTPEQVALIRQAITDHPYSKGRMPASMEGKLLQDADRLDALGAVGIARTFAEGRDRALYAEEDPMGESRPLDDHRYTLDHFGAKLLKLPDGMHTPEARAIATQRVGLMRVFLKCFAADIGATPMTDEETG
jgi:uncharacterized protein